MRIENYLGFPTGISGIALMARAYNQAQKFGAEIAIPDEVTSLVAHDAAVAPVGKADHDRREAPRGIGRCTCVQMSEATELQRRRDDYCPGA
jgi:hypothetical protein